MGHLICNMQWGITYITRSGAFTTIYFFVFFIYDMYHNVNYNMLSSALNKQYRSML